MKSRVATSVVLAAMIAGSMSACAFITPQQTTKSYDPKAGVNGTAGDVEIRNMLVVASADGKTGSLVGALVNTSSSTKTVTVQYASSTGTSSQQVEVPSGLLSLQTDGGTTASPDTGGTETEQVLLNSVDTTPGGLFSVSFLTGSASESLRLPVLTGSLEQYATLVPTPSPTPTKTKKPKPTESATPGATDTATPDVSATPSDSASAG